MNAGGLVLPPPEPVSAGEPSWTAEPAPRPPAVETRIPLVEEPPAPTRGTDPPFVVPPSLYLHTLLRAGRFLLRYPGALPLLLQRRWAALEPVKRRMSLDYLRRGSAVGWARSEGFEILLDPEDSAFVSPSIDLFGWHEIATTMLFDYLVRPGDRVVDVGAGIGWFSLLAARRVGPRGRVVALEPEPRSHRLLGLSIERNGFANVRTLAAAAWNDLGHVTLHLSPGPNRGAHSVTRELGGPSLTVPTVRLDDVLDAARFADIDLLKVDTEGAEPQVLEGAREALRGRRIRAIALEWNPEAWAPAHALLAELSRAYRVYRYDGNVPFRRLKPLSDLRSQPPGCALLIRRPA